MRDGEMIGLVGKRENMGDGQKLDREGERQRERHTQ